MINTRKLTEALEKKYRLNESYWWEDWENLPKERTDEISKWAKNYVNEICKYDLRNYDITGPKFEDSNEKFIVIINNKIFNFDWEDVWVNKAYYDENREETLPDDHEYIYDTIDDDPIGYRIISTIESSVDYSDGKLNESWEEEFDDEYDAIMDDDLLSDNEKATQIELLRQKYDRKNESYNGKDAKLEDLLVNSGIFYSWNDDDTIDFADSYEAKKAYELLKDNGFNTDIIDFDELQLHFDLLNESLTEARNPENDEVNAIIRKHLGKKSRISKKEQEILDRYNISRNEYGDFIGPNGKTLMSTGRKSVQGPEVPANKYTGRGRKIWDWSAERSFRDGTEDSFNEVDYANYLTKEQPGEGQSPYGNNRYYNERDLDGMRYPTPSEDKALRPYSDTYKTLKDILDKKEYDVEYNKKHQPMSDEEIEAKVAEFRAQLERDRQTQQEWDADDQEEYNDAKKAFDDFRASIPRR